MQKRIGIIGMGLLGGAVAARFKDHDWLVEGYDISHDRRSEAQERGVQLRADVGDVIAHNKLVLVSLPTGKVVLDVLSRHQDRLFAGQLIVDTTTALPAEMQACAAMVRQQQAAYLEANVAGSSAQARAGQVLVMVGGEAEDYAAARPALSVFAEKTLHVGGSGNGIRFKLVHNLMLGLSRAALAESLALAAALELEPLAALEVLRASPAAYSRVMDTKGEKMVGRDFSQQATLRQHLKDVELMLREGSAAGQELPFSQVHRSVLENLVELGYGDEDNSAIIRAYD